MKKTLALVLSLVMLLTAATAMAATEINYWSVFTGGDGAVMQGMVDAFNASQDEVKVNHTPMTADDLYQKVLTICGMPNRNGGSSTSDTGTAVIYRDGFAEAESRAKNTEKSWLRSETAFLKLVLHICSNTQGAEIELDIHNVRPEFTRKNFSNIQSKAQVLAELLNNSKVHPKYAYIISGLFPDAEEAYRAGMEWNNTQQAEMEKTIEEAMKREREERVRTGGQSDTATEEEGDPEV